jgi:transposase-like protein
MNNLEQLSNVGMPKKDKMHMARAGQLKMIKYNQIKLKEELEKYDFEQLADNTTEQEEKRRFLALSYLKNGKNIQEVADAVKVSCSSINAWIRQFNKNKLEGLKKADRRKPHLEIYYSQKQNFQHLADNTTREIA